MRNSVIPQPFPVDRRRSHHAGRLKGRRSDLLGPKGNPILRANVINLPFDARCSRSSTKLSYSQARMLTVCNSQGHAPLSGNNPGPPTTRPCNVPDPRNTKADRWQSGAQHLLGGTPGLGHPLGAAHLDKSLGTQNGWLRRTAPSRHIGVQIKF